MRTPIYFNKTFSFGRDVNLNACVGNNGIQDHRKYGFGYDEAAKLLITAAKQHDITIDAAIYPLVFCARHRIELFLKDQLINFTIIRENRDITEKLLSSTHDLGILWKLFKTHGAKTDRRIIEFIKKAEDYIIDFSEIDPTGETFRYPYDKHKTVHLIKTPIINIAIFGKRYSKLSSLMDDFEHLTKYLIDEYQQKTFTKELSRQDICDISIILPQKEYWSLSSFDKIKIEIKKKYGLSGRKLSNAIDVVKSHREFCINIGIELPLRQTTTENISSYINLYNEYQAKARKSIKTNGYLLQSQKEIKSTFIKKVKSNLPKTAIICIYTLIELGMLDYFSEAFDFLYNKYESEMENEYDLLKYCSFIINNQMALKFIRTALVKTGQVSLIRDCFTQKYKKWERLTSQFSGPKK
jgi:hypothetical protein